MTKTTSIYVISILSLSSALFMFGIHVLMSPRQSIPIFTMTHILGGSAGYATACDGSNCTKIPGESIDFSFIPSEQWRIKLGKYANQSLESYGTYNFSDMYFKYRNGSMLNVPNGCYPIQHWIALFNGDTPLNCANLASGNYTIYGYEDK